MATISDDIYAAKKLLEKGDVIGIPTETVYGLAGNALNIEAVLKIFEVKNRPQFDPLIVHSNSLEKIEQFVTEIPTKAQKLATSLWPGPLTLLLPKQNNIPDLVTSGIERVAVRIPNHSLTLQLLSQLDFPVAAPSANPFGYISPTSATHVEAQLGTKIPMILDGGECTVGIESTIVGFENNETVVYRLGGVAIEVIESLVGKVRLMQHSTSNPAAPGMLKSHYAPRKKLLISQCSVGKRIRPIIDSRWSVGRVGYLNFDAYFDDISYENQRVMSLNGDLNEAASNFFAYLRELDNLDIDVIYSELLPEVGLGRAINDRLRRASVD